MGQENFSLSSQTGAGGFERERRAGLALGRPSGTYEFSFTQETFLSLPKIASELPFCCKWKKIAIANIWVVLTLNGILIWLQDADSCWLKTYSCKNRKMVLVKAPEAFNLPKISVSTWAEPHFCSRFFSPLSSQNNAVLSEQMNVSNSGHLTFIEK